MKWLRKGELYIIQKEREWESLTKPLDFTLARPPVLSYCVLTWHGLEFQATCLVTHFTSLCFPCCFFLSPLLVLCSHIQYISTLVAFDCSTPSCTLWLRLVWGIWCLTTTIQLYSAELVRTATAPALLCCEYKPLVAYPPLFIVSHHQAGYCVLGIQFIVLMGYGPPHSHFWLLGSHQSATREH